MPVKVLIYDAFSFFCVLGQHDLPENLGLLSEQVSLNFTQPSVLDKKQCSFITA